MEVDRDRPEQLQSPTVDVHLTAHILLQHGLHVLRPLPLEQLLLHAANHAAVKYDKQAASSYLPLESPDDDDIVIETGASAKTSTL